MKLKNDRRSFLRNSSLALAGMSLSGVLPLEALGRQKLISPNEKVHVAVVGCKGMGWSNLRSHLLMEEVECVALCDVDKNVLEERARDVMKARGQKPKLYGDYRKLLDNKDVDAVIIGTPDHWHCLIALDALDAGKHVYVEKPLANSIGECQLMIEAARKSDRIIQVGQWQRSGPHYRRAIDYVQSGKLGNIRLVKVGLIRGGWDPVPVKPDSAPPEGVDYKMWLGPAPERPFNPNRFHFNFRWFWDYAGGLMTDWGVHEIDIALYAMKASAPKSVMASGGKLAYPDDASETPDTLQAVFEYDNFNMLWEHATGIDGGNYGKTEGIAFIGNKATLVLNRQGWEIIPEKGYDEEKDLSTYQVEAIPYQGRQGNYLDLHTENFIKSIKENDADALNCPLESGAVAAINAHMGNIAFKTGQKIYWDEVKGQFKDNTAANNMITATYHNGWKLPE